MKLVKISFSTVVIACAMRGNASLIVGSDCFVSNVCSLVKPQAVRLKMVRVEHRVGILTFITFDLMIDF
jgi:hypothetical protein